MESLTGFERLLFRLYTDQQFREAVQRDPDTYGLRYNLSALELAALKSLDWNAFVGNLLTPIEPHRCCGGQPACHF
jgi:hypothetical protein